MAKLSDLVSVFAFHGVDAAGTLTLFSRRLREAGRVSKAKRGRGAAAMTYLDAARFLIALGATDHPERVQEVEPFFSRALPYCIPSRKEGLHPIHEEIVARDLPFDQATACLIERSREIDAEVSMRTYFDIERSLGGGSITIGDSCVRFSQPRLRDLSVGNVRPADRTEWRKLNDVAMAESGTYATGKSIRATFDIFLVAALKRAIASGGDSQ